jgi:hypothetical protein
LRTINKDDWTYCGIKNNHNPKNQELITLRAKIVGKKLSLRVSIGLVICELLDLKKGDRVNIYIHKKDKNFLLVSKCQPHEIGLKLCHALHSNFLTFDFTCYFYSEFKIRQTIMPDFQFNQEKLLLIDLTKLKWEK